MYQRLVGILIILTFDDTKGDVYDSDLNDSDGAVHGNAATAAVDDDNDDDDGDDAKDDDNDNDDDDGEQTHGISGLRRKLAVVFIVSQRTLWQPITPDDNYDDDDDDNDDNDDDAVDICRLADIGAAD